MSVTVEQLQQVAQRLAQLEVQKDAELAVLAANLEKERGERAQDQAVLQASLEQEREVREKEKAAHDEEMKKVLLAGLKNETDKEYFPKSTKLWSFGGERTKFREWAFKVRGAIGAADPELLQLLEVVEKREDVISKAMLGDELYKKAAKFYHEVTNWVTGDAFTMLQNTPDKNGVEYWRNLVQLFDPVSKKKAKMTIKQLVNPPAAQKIEDTAAAIHTWEKQVNEYELKICLLYTSPSPRDRQKSRMPSSA